VILAFALSCFPAPLGCAPAASSTVLGWGSLGDANCFYFVNQPTGKTRSLVTLMDLKLFCNNYVVVFMGAWIFLSFVSYNQIALT